MGGDWDIPVGTTLPRRQLHARWGGGWYGGMEPAVKANSVFLFSKPSAGKAFGYVFDGWQSDGTFHYTGDGQEGDQSPADGGNRALLNAATLGRTIRLFRSEGTDTTYIGVFALDEQPYLRDDAPDKYGEMRSVLVFRLRPVGHVLRDQIDEASADAVAPEELPLEASNVDFYVIARPDEPPVAVRREAELVHTYAQWLKNEGHDAVRHRIPIPEGGHLFTDVFNKSTSELVEAKASTARVYVRAGLGQVLDYSRYLDHASKALLLPAEPTSDLVELLHAYGVNVIWKAGNTFSRRDAPTRA